MTTGKNASFFMLVTLALRLRGYELWWSLSRSARDALDHVEDCWNKESADERFRYHTAYYRRAHDLACDRTCSRCCPERHATKNKGERCHHEGPEAKSRRGKRRIGNGHTSFVVLLRKCDDQ